MIHIVWEFRVRPGKEPEFERRYSVKQAHEAEYAALDADCGP